MAVRVQGGKSVDAKAPPVVQAHPRIKVLKPVWLFCDDVENITRQLKQIGHVEISTDKVHLIISDPEGSSDYKKIWENRPVRWLWFCLRKDSASLASIVVHPTHVEFRKSHDWNPSESEDNVLEQVEEYLRSRRHFLFFLGERGWQLACAFGALLVLLGAGVSTLHETPNLLLAVLGIVMSVPTMAWIAAGRFLPSRSRVTLWGISREEFWRRVRRWIYIILSALAVFACGFTLGVLVATRR